jgi:hypothetical protein
MGRPKSLSPIADAGLIASRIALALDEDLRSNHG